MRLRRWLVLLTATLAALAGVMAPPATAGVIPIGRLGEPLRVEFKGLVAEVSVNNIAPSPVPPGFGYPPRAPRYQVYRADVTITPIQVPTPYAMGITYQFRGVTPTGDAYEPRNSDAPDALQLGMQSARVGQTFTGGVWWDCYRDLVSNVVLLDKITGVRLAQWNVA
ncbi:hypothetical protein Mycch_2189 [Mycolicibacterium chubuense NBB4]|uniref:Exported alanine and valine rich protein n=1 Tax=Mycolicibacterium chubuense (strain NBB4) TaxID=710421 RepID=I4BI65_MYCCN|nr:hypothetical protein Mycch_2189 [Mycolicibacterium chubuense NBB4]